MEEAAFNKVKAAYVQARENERKKLIGYLADNGFEATTLGGMGRFDYNGKGRLEKPYDLTNWKYIEAFKDGILYFISFQAFDHDTGSRNWHVLMDRIGVYRYACPSFSKRDTYWKKCYKDTDAFRVMSTSVYDLPLSENDMQDLVDWMQALDVLVPDSPLKKRANEQAVQQAHQNPEGRRRNPPAAALLQSIKTTSD